jgi:D-amino-acid oxidase
MRVSRRGFVTGAATLLAGCARRVAITPPAIPAARLARVRATQERVIRTIAGLRPFRPSGFVVRAEKIGEKLVIHNYGHGGAGITLSWGTSQLAVEQAAASEARDCAVIGCGVVGLSTARLLQQRGYNPVIYAREVPPGTTSNVAGGLWEPVSLFDHDRVTPEFRRQFAAAARFAHRRYQSLAGDLYGVRWLPLYRLSRRPIALPPATSPNSDVEPLYPEKKMLDRSEHPFDVPFVERRYSMLIEPAIYLNALIRDFQLSGGKIAVREFRAIEEVLALKEQVVFNCTGLGARSLFGDTELIPIKGQLALLLPQPEVQYMTLGPSDTYMFPRHDGILLGESFENGVENTDVDPAAVERIVRDNAAVFDSMRA